MRENEELMRNLKISDNSGHLVPYSARKPLNPKQQYVNGRPGHVAWVVNLIN